MKANLCIRKVRMPDTHSYSQSGLLVKKVLVAGLKAYQRLSRAVVFRNCRFHPSCSQYAIEAIERFGVISGVKKASVRILRCSPLSDGGYDPVR